MIDGPSSAHATHLGIEQYNGGEKTKCVAADIKGADNGETRYEEG